MSFFIRKCFVLTFFGYYTLGNLKNLAYQFLSYKKCFIFTWLQRHNDTYKTMKINVDFMGKILTWFQNGYTENILSSIRDNLSANSITTLYCAKLPRVLFFFFFFSFLSSLDANNNHLLHFLENIPNYPAQFFSLC